MVENNDRQKKKSGLEIGENLNTTWSDEVTFVLMKDILGII